MNRKLLAIFIFSIIGTLFAGFLTIPSLLTGTCPIDGECPFFLGQPACLYGLVMYLILLLASSMLLLSDRRPGLWKNMLLIVSGIGIIFSGYFSVKDVFFCTGPCEFTLLLPTCVYGLIMYIIIFIFSLLYGKQQGNSH